MEQYVIEVAAYAGLALFVHYKSPKIFRPSYPEVLLWIGMMIALARCCS
jgi:hypothetical protein